MFGGSKGGLSSFNDGGFGLGNEERDEEDDDVAVGAQRTIRNDRDSADLPTATSDKKRWERVVGLTAERKTLLKKTAVDSSPRERLPRTSIPILRLTGALIVQWIKVVRGRSLISH